MATARKQPDEFTALSDADKDALTWEQAADYVGRDLASLKKWSDCVKRCRASSNKPADAVADFLK